MRYVGRSKLSSSLSGSFEGGVHRTNWNCCGGSDEAVLWLELLNESGITKPELTEDLLKEARELAAILTASQQTAKRTG
jgi:hypothetical protein